MPFPAGGFSVLCLRMDAPSRTRKIFVLIRPSTRGSIQFRFDRVPVSTRPKQISVPAPAAGKVTSPSARRRFRENKYTVPESSRSYCRQRTLPFHAENTHISLSQRRAAHIRHRAVLGIGGHSVPADADGKFRRLRHLLCDGDLIKILSRHCGNTANRRQRMVQGDDPALGPLRRERGRLLWAGPPALRSQTAPFHVPMGKVP